MSDPEQIRDALALGVTGDVDGALALLQPLVDRGPRTAYAVCGALAETASHTARTQQAGRGWFGLAVETADGTPASVDVLPPDLRFSVQFVTAWANRDQDTATALFDALVAGGDVGGGICALFDLAVLTARGVVAEQRAKRAAEGER